MDFLPKPFELDQLLELLAPREPVVSSSSGHVLCGIGGGQPLYSAGEFHGIAAAFTALDP